MKYLIFVISFSLFFIKTNSFGQGYKTNLEKCYSTFEVPSLNSSDVCVGLVADNKEVQWTMPRKIVFVDNTIPASGRMNANPSIAVVTAMGGWKQNLGQVWKLNLNKGQLISSELLFRNTDRTHGLAVGRNEWIYYADSTKVYRFKIKNPISSREVVVSGLPDTYTDRNNQTTSSSHPLKEIIFLDNWDMIVNIGAPSNDCSEEFKAFRACHQRDQQAELRKYIYNPSTDSYPGDYEVIARGLRNSMGLLFNPATKEIYQAENASDNLGTPDELNIINPNALASDQDFGWPFCFGNKNSYVGFSRFSNFCNNTSIAPYLLLPAHAAPLDMKYYPGGMFADLKNSILMSWHGHRPSGSKIAVYETDGNLAPNTRYSSDLSTAPQPPLQLLTSRWEKAEPGHPKGRPVGIGFDKFGAIFVIDDVNHTLLVISKKGSNAVQEEFPAITSATEIIEDDLADLFSEDKIRKWTEVSAKLTELNCQNCHSDIISNNQTQTLLNLVNSNWINPKSKNLEDQLIWIRLTGFNGAKIMPPAPAPNILTNNLYLEVIESWIQDIE